MFLSQQSEEKCAGLAGSLACFARVDVKMVELAGKGTAPCKAEREASVTQNVDGRKILGEVDRVMQWQEEGCRAEPDFLCSPGEERHERER